MIFWGFAFFVLDLALAAALFHVAFHRGRAAQDASWRSAAIGKAVRS